MCPKSLSPQSGGTHRTGVINWIKVGRISCSILCSLLNGAVKCYVPSLKAGILCASCRALQRTGFLSSLHNHLFLLWCYPSPLDQQQTRAEIKSLSSTLQWKPVKLELKQVRLYHSCKPRLAEQTWLAQGVLGGMGVGGPARSQRSRSLPGCLEVSARLGHPSGRADPP